MFASDHIVVRHAKKVVDHVKKHHHTYLFFGGLAGGVFLVVKIIMLFATSYMLYNASHDASFANDSVLSTTGSVGESTGTVVTGEVLTGDSISTGSALSGDFLSGSDTSTGTVISTGVVSTGDFLTGSDVSTGTTVSTGTIVSTGAVLSGSDASTGTTVSTGSVVDSGSYGFQPVPTVCNYSGFSSNITSGAIYSGLMNLSWLISPSCADEILSIQLYDHNEEWITLAKVSGTTTKYTFDTNLLGSGFYSRTGVNASGNTVVVYSGVYSGISMNSWTGYHVRWLVEPDTILSETSSFTIDNKKPTLSNISLRLGNLLSGMAAVGTSVVIQFDASELLTGVRVVINGTGQAVFSGLSGLHYNYRYTLPANLSSGYLTYTISYQDLAGLTGSVIGSSQIFLDSTYPLLSNFALSGYDFSFVTSELTRATSFVLLKNTTNGRAFSMTGLSTGHTFSLPTLSLNTEYDMGIVAQDIAGNEGKAAFSLKRNGSGTISFTLLATLYGQTLTTYASGVTFLSTTGTTLVQTVQQSGQQISILEKVKKEIDRFTVCKNNIDFGTIKLQIKGKELSLSMPEFKKNETKKLVNAFILYILKSLEKSPLSESELEDITKNFNSFLVILKLVRDDDNSCKQNLSNYHLEQFKQSLETYGISL